MKKTFEGDYEFNKIEIDIEKNIYLVDGKPLERCLELSITVQPFKVITKIKRDEIE